MDQLEAKAMLWIASLSAGVGVLYWLSLGRLAVWQWLGVAMVIGGGLTSQALAWGYPHGSFMIEASPVELMVVRAAVWWVIMGCIIFLVTGVLSHRREVGTLVPFLEREEEPFLPGRL